MSICSVLCTCPNRRLPHRTAKATLQKPKAALQKPHLAARDVFHVISELPADVGTTVTVSAALVSIMQAKGETALVGKQPVRERIVDALRVDAAPRRHLRALH